MYQDQSPQFPQQSFGQSYAGPAQGSYAVPQQGYADAYPMEVSSGKASSFKKLNCCAFITAIAIFALLVASASVDWYKYTETYQANSSDATQLLTTTTLNYTRRYYDLQGLTNTMKSTTGTETSRFSDHNDDNSNVWSIFKLCEAFVIIGLVLSGLLAFFLALCFADSVRNKLLFWAGMNVLRISLMVVGILVLISSTIAFLGFLGITDAFDEDIPNCTLGYCRKFIDSQKNEMGIQMVQVSGATAAANYAITATTSWGAEAGWYLVLATVPMAILLIILVVLNKFPIPIESVGSGEAL
jgi:hypothetical protein